MTGRLLGIGVDGAPGGWIAACAFGAAAGDAPTAPRSEPRFFASIDELAAWRSAQLGGDDAPVAVDIPIGLPDVVRYRACDEVARSRMPGPRKGSVFHAPPRYLLQRAAVPVDGKPPGARVVFARVQDAIAENQRAADAVAAEAGVAVEPLLKLSQQGTAILVKVAEVDAFLRGPKPPGAPDRQQSLFEVHPEMSFRALNGGVVLPSKTTALGQLQRLDVVRREFPTLRSAFAPGPAQRGTASSTCSTPTQRAGRRCAGRRPAPAHPSGVRASLRRWRS